MAYSLMWLAFSSIVLFTRILITFLSTSILWAYTFLVADDVSQIHTFTDLCCRSSKLQAGRSRALVLVFSRSLLVKTNASVKLAFVKCKELFYVVIDQAKGMITFETCGLQLVRPMAILHTYGLQ